MNTTEKHVSTANAFEEAASLIRQQRLTQTKKLDHLQAGHRLTEAELAEALQKTSHSMRSA